MHNPIPIIMPHELSAVNTCTYLSASSMQCKEEEEEVIETAQTVMGTDV